MSVLLSHGFQLALSPDYTDMLDQAAELKSSCSLTVTRAGLVTLTVGGEAISAEQLDPMKPDDAEWLEEARHGSVLVIAGNNPGHHRKCVGR